ncbi:hypothetical protein NE237_006255 [Protea cynaroides]|uniref:RING-type E3 ubiquitin transferase n=1 Tax=Protea cynaroides TaxID=273540 RepID=A0A9Q0KMS0_9MAGN|nr:hypothetical protein NE237_006255 [Protea cynaroides]
MMSAGTPGDYSDQSGWKRLDAIISLAVLFAIMIVVYSCLWCVYRRHARQLTMHTHSQGQGLSSSTGQDSSMVASIPTFVYRQSIQVDKDARECAVCLGTLEEGEMARLLPNCKHTFHVECINMWLISHSTCPICRSSVESLGVDI